MHALLDLTPWQGRIDADEGERARRWHQWVRPVTSAQEPGAVLLGFASDEGVQRNQGRVGACEGPLALRRALSNLAWHGQRTLYDGGDVACRDGDLEGAQQRFAADIQNLLDAGHFPIGLGGGHEIAFASYNGLADHLASQQPEARIGILNFDAHFDLRHAALASSGTPFRQIAERCSREDRPFNYCCLGVSRANNTAALFDAAERLQVRYLLDHQMHTGNLPLIERTLDAFLDEIDHLYLTLCLDVLPAAQAPGVSAPAAHGVELALVEHLLRRIKTSSKLRLADIAELNPRLDIDSHTARCAARLVACLLE